MNSTAAHCFYPQEKRMRVKGYILYHPEFGIFLGAYNGQGYWSQVCPAGIMYAVTFDTKQDADEFVASWIDPLAKNTYHTCEVLHNGNGFATIQECTDAGLPPWCPFLAIPEAIH